MLLLIFTSPVVWGSSTVEETEKTSLSPTPQQLSQERARCLPARAGLSCLQLAGSFVMAPEILQPCRQGDWEKKAMSVVQPPGE